MDFSLLQSTAKALFYDELTPEPEKEQFYESMRFLVAQLYRERTLCVANDDKRGQRRFLNVKHANCQAGKNLRFATFNTSKLTIFIIFYKSKFFAVVFAITNCSTEAQRLRKLILLVKKKIFTGQSVDLQLYPQKQSQLTKWIKLTWSGNRCDAPSFKSLNVFFVVARLRALTNIFWVHRKRQPKLWNQLSIGVTKKTNAVTKMPTRAISSRH